MKKQAISKFQKPPLSKCGREQHIVPKRSLFAWKSGHENKKIYRGIYTYPRFKTEATPLKLAAPLVRVKELITKELAPINLKTKDLAKK